MHECCTDATANTAALEYCSINGNTVSVFYLRAGYTPDDYPTADEWQAREMMEQCSAVSCPSVAYQLVGAKKIQQDLAVPGAPLVVTIHTSLAQHTQCRHCLAICNWASSLSLVPCPGVQLRFDAEMLAFELHVLFARAHVTSTVHRPQFCFSLM